MSSDDDRRELLRQWLTLGDEDVATARHILDISPSCPFSAVCFHAQQCAEKYIKGLLVWNSIAFPRTHDIGELAALLPKDVVLPIDIALQERLTHYATISRYPGDWHPLTRQEAQDALGAAEEIRRFVLTLLANVVDP